MTFECLPASTLGNSSLKDKHHWHTNAWMQIHTSAALNRITVPCKWNFKLLIPDLIAGSTYHTWKQQFWVSAASGSVSPGTGCGVCSETSRCQRTGLPWYLWAGTWQSAEDSARIYCWDPPESCSHKAKLVSTAIHKYFNISNSVVRTHFATHLRVRYLLQVHKEGKQR